MTNKWLIIENDGLIDTAGLYLMGVTSKEGHDKIGFFGTGTKYAMATLLRKGIKFKIYSGVSEIHISTNDTIFRGEVYKQISIDGKATSLTTRMGPDWETWYAIREFVCNAIDEGGYKLYTSDTINASEYKTIVAIELCNEILNIYDNIDTYIITNKIPYYTGNTQYGDISIYNNNKDPIFYRKGIRINNNIKNNALYAYDFINIEITESRIYKYEHTIYERIASILAVCTKYDIINNYICNWKNHIESLARWEYVHDKFSQQWNNILIGKDICPHSIAMEHGAREDINASYVLPDKLCEKLANQFPDLRIIGMTKMKYIETEPSIDQLKIIDEAMHFLNKCGYIINNNIKYVSVLNNSVMGWYDGKTNFIYLCTNHIDTLEHTIELLLEEYWHTLGYQDGSRRMTDSLLREIIALQMTIHGSNTID